MRPCLPPDFDVIPCQGHHRSTAETLINEPVVLTFFSKRHHIGGIPLTMATVRPICVSLSFGSFLNVGLLMFSLNDFPFLMYSWHLNCFTVSRVFALRAAVPECNCICRSFGIRVVFNKLSAKWRLPFAHLTFVSCKCATDLSIFAVSCPASGGFTFAACSSRSLRWCIAVSRTYVTLHFRLKIAVAP